MSDLPGTIYEINALSLADKQKIYYSFLPDWIFTRFNVDRTTLKVDGRPVVTLRCPAGSYAMELTVKHHPDARDPIFSLNVADTSTYQLLVLLLIINDPSSPRFDIDVDEHGHSTNFGTNRRNLTEEQRAMEFGLAPGQVRRGLRVFRHDIPIYEDIVRRMGHDMFFIEPFAYHNAIAFERYGFGYTFGKKDMEAIHAEFSKDGSLRAKLDGSTPFRQPDAWKTVRGRSWAIHDGILGHQFSGFRMYKLVGKNANINTFPDAQS